MKIIRPRPAAEKLGIGLPTLWAWARDKPDFPQPVRLSGNASGFVEDELDAWLAAQVTAYRAQPPQKRETAIVAAQKSALARRQRKAQEADRVTA